VYTVRRRLFTNFEAEQKYYSIAIIIVKFSNAEQLPGCKLDGGNQPYPDTNWSFFGNPAQLPFPNCGENE